MLSLPFSLISSKKKGEEKRGWLKQKVTVWVCVLITAWVEKMKSCCKWWLSKAGIYSKQLQKNAANLSFLLPAVWRRTNQECRGKESTSCTLVEGIKHFCLRCQVINIVETQTLTEQLVFRGIHILMWKADSRNVTSIEETPNKDCLQDSRNGAFSLRLHYN